MSKLINYLAINFTQKFRHYLTKCFKLVHGIFFIFAFMNLINYTDVRRLNYVNQTQIPDLAEAFPLMPRVGTAVDANLPAPFGQPVK